MTCENIVKMFRTKHFLLKLDDSTTHYIIATSAPLNLLKKKIIGKFKNITVGRFKIYSIWEFENYSEWRKIEKK